MAKLIPDAIIDLELEVIAAATILFICKDTPTTYADAAGTYDLATHILTPAIGGGDFTSANGDGGGGGRKLTLAAQNGITVDHNGTATYYVLGISATTTLLLIGTISSQVLTAGNLVNFPPTDVLEIGDVT
jgi:hypothetical protein